MKTSIRLALCTVLATLVPALGACSKTVAIDLKLVEPCNQKNQSLNGISSFVVSTTGETPQVVAFSVDQGAAPVDIGLGSVMVTVQAFAEDVSTSGATSTKPQSVGRTLPFDVTEQSADLSALVTVGKLDSFGKTTDADGNCTFMTDGAPVSGRHGHTATYIPVLNQVLIYGGAVWAAGVESLLATAELYDPATGTFTELTGVDGARAYHAATAMPDGRVLISGGFGVIDGTLTTLQTGVIFDPKTLADPFSTILLKQARAHHTSTLMAGSNLIVLAGGCVGVGDADGCTTTSAGSGNHGGTPRASTDLTVNIETFDVKQATGAAATVAVPANTSLGVGRAFHQATSLETDPPSANGLLVITGGANPTGPVCDVEVFRASGGALTRAADAEAAGFPAGKCPVRHAAVAINPQRLVVIGGTNQAPGGTPSNVGSPDVFFFSTTNGMEQTASLTLFNGGGRVGHLASKLQDGSILIAGGIIGAGAPTAEVLRPDAANGGVLSAQVLVGPPLGAARDHAAMAILPNNELLLTGGYTTTPPFTTANAAELLFGP